MVARPDERGRLTAARYDLDLKGASLRPQRLKAPHFGPSDEERHNADQRRPKEHALRTQPRPAFSADHTPQGPSETIAESTVECLPLGMMCALKVSMNQSDRRRMGRSKSARMEDLSHDQAKGVSESSA